MFSLRLRRMHFDKEWRNETEKEAANNLLRHLITCIGHIAMAGEKTCLISQNFFSSMKRVGLVIREALSVISDLIYFFLAFMRRGDILLASQLRPHGGLTDW